MTISFREHLLFTQLEEDFGHDFVTTLNGLSYTALGGLAAYEAARKIGPGAVQKLRGTYHGIKKQFGRRMAEFQVSHLISELKKKHEAISPEIKPDYRIMRKFISDSRGLGEVQIGPKDTPEKKDPNLAYYQRSNRDGSDLHKLYLSHRLVYQHQPIHALHGIFHEIGHHFDMSIDHEDYGEKNPYIPAMVKDLDHNANLEIAHKIGPEIASDGRLQWSGGKHGDLHIHEKARSLGIHNKAIINFLNDSNSFHHRALDALHHKDLRGFLDSTVVWSRGMDVIPVSYTAAAVNGIAAKGGYRLPTYNTDDMHVERAAREAAANAFATNSGAVHPVMAKAMETFFPHTMRASRDRMQKFGFFD